MNYHFHVLLRQRGQPPIIDYRTTQLGKAKAKVRNYLINELVCTKDHDKHDIKCFTYDVPTMSAKIAANHCIHGYPVDSVELFDCSEPSCYKKVKT